MATIHVPVGATPAATRQAIQAAIDSAVAGDVITLAAGQYYQLDTTSIKLRNKGAMADYITIRSDADDADLPADGVRIDTSYEPFLPKLQHTGARAVFETDTSAQKYKIMCLEFLSNDRGFGEIIMLGHNDTSQVFFDQQPNDIIIDRVWIHGDPVCGQKRGVGMNGRNLVVKNSRIEGIFGVGQDTQACAVQNGSGPLSIINNYLSAAGYSFISGGDAPKMFTWATVATTPAPTTTSAKLNTFRSGHTIATMRVGMHISIRVLGGTERRHTYVRSINAATNEITFDPIDTVPDAGEGTAVTDSGGEVLGYTGSDIIWGEQPIGLTFQRNHVTRPLTWLDPILSTPANVTASPGSSGSIAPGTYFYRVQAKNPDGYTGVDTYSKASPEVSVSVGSNGSVSLSWDAVPGATEYRVYRGTSTGTVSKYFTSSSTSFTDTGAAGTSATSIASSTGRILKNLFELKFAMDVQINANIFENHWPGSESGWAIWIKSNHYGDYASFVKTKNVVIENNIIRHVAGIFSLLVYIGNDPKNILAGPLENVIIRNNLMYDSDTNWLYGDASLFGMKVEGEVQGLTFEHNTFLHGMRGTMTFDKYSRPLVNGVFRHNLFRKEQYGVFGQTTTAGSATIEHYIADWSDNVMAGASGYPAGTQQPSYAEFEANFVNYDGGTNGDYHLAPGSPYIGGATDGKDLGCDMAVLDAAVANTLTGGAVTQPPTISTASMSSGQATSPYSQGIAVSGGTAPYVWAVTSGSLPPGLTLNANTGVISGTPTTAGTYPFSIQVTDSESLTDSVALSISIAAAPVPLDITTLTLPNGVVGETYSQVLQATGGTAPYTWTIAGGTLPAGLTLASDGTISGTPTDAAVASITVRVADSVGGSDTQVLGLTVAGEVLPANRPIRWDSAEAKVFRRPTAPTTSDDVVKGDIWIDTSTNPPTLNGCISNNPVQWLALGGSGGGAHALLSSSHTDAAPDAPVEGDLVMAAGDPVKWSRFPIGPSGAYLRSNGVTVDYVPVNASEIGSGTLDNARLPAQLDIASRVNAPTFGCDNYIAFTEMADPGAPSNPRFGRFFYDIADRKFKVWENGVKRSLADGSGGSGAASACHVSFVAGSQVQGVNIPIGGAEFPSTSKNRIVILLAGMTQIKLYAYISVAAVSGAKLRIQYFDGTNWVSPLSSGELEVPMDTTGDESSPWGLLAGGATSDIILCRMFVTDGNGSTDPAVTNVQLIAKP